MKSLLKLKGFSAFLSIVFLNTFVDVGHKVLIQNTLYQTTGGAMYTILAACVNALILLPYLFFFAPSGFLSDRFSKTKVLQVTAALAIPMTMVATAFYYLGFFWLSFSMTLLLAIQSVFNSPAKYGYIKEAFGKENLAQTNALLQTIVIFSILASTFAFSWIFSHAMSVANISMRVHEMSVVIKAFAPAGFLLVAFSTVEFLLTLILPKTAVADPTARYDTKLTHQVGVVKKYMHLAYQHRVVFICILGLSVFWAINQVLLASYGAYLKTYVEGVGTLFAQGAITIGGLGILIGALYAGRISRGFIETGGIPIAAIGVTVGLFLMPTVENRALILLLFLIYGFCGGMLVVPLNALIQFNAEQHDLGKVLAANNFIQNGAMLVFLAATAILAAVGGSSILILRILMFVAVGATVVAFIKLPQSLSRYVLYFIISKFYRMQVYDLENLPSTGGVLLLGNHTSYLDWAIVQIASPRPVRFVMDRSIYAKWYFKWILKAVNVIPISRAGSKESLKAVRDALNNEEVVVIFPEGYLSRNGQLGRFHSGYTHAVEGTKARIVPFYHRGLWGTLTSLATSHYKIVSRVRMRNVSIAFGKPLPADACPGEVKRAVFELSIQTWRHYTASMGSIADEWLRRAKEMGSAFCVADSSGRELSYHQLMAAVFFVAEKWTSRLKGQQNIGILLPPSVAGVIANLACFVRGKTVVNLNYTAGVEQIAYAIEAASIRTVVTSETFLHKLKAKGFHIESALEHVKVIHLEKYKQRLSQVRIFFHFLFVKLMPMTLLKSIYITHRDNNSVAAILFSSGSEGKPKGVELTHRNILGNARQVTSIVSSDDTDVLMSTLPLFHAFGLTATTIMPLVEGIPFVCHPDPTDALKIGRLIYQYQATILCGTSTLFGVYCRNQKLHPLMLKSLRLVIAGSEKLSPKVKQAFKERFDLTIYEGYGTTEVSPVASTNMPDILNPDDWHVHISSKEGTVGLPLPGSAFRIVDPETLAELPVGEAGLILIGGTQVMRGYLNDPEKTASVLIQEGDITWYKTGDKGFLDADGFLTIVDRYARFAKIGGEMVSLSWLEEKLSDILGEAIELMLIALSDEKRGERLVMLYVGDLDEASIRATIRASDLANLFHPTVYKQLDTLPKLGSGKRDYVSAKAMVLADPA